MSKPEQPDRVKEAKSRTKSQPAEHCFVKNNAFDNLLTYIFIEESCSVGFTALFFSLISSPGNSVRQFIRIRTIHKLSVEKILQQTRIWQQNCLLQEQPFSPSATIFTFFSHLWWLEPHVCCISRLVSDLPLPCAPVVEFWQSWSCSWSFLCNAHMQIDQIWENVETV